ncbi:MAG: membrane lipoprotein lipid attachment site-containing protein [Proteobacteria bacterium]|nr:membrane lipoprotein lipid attachment site-containing protein [Pseudomonadota bacterium]
MKKTVCVLVMAALLAGCSQSNEERLAGNAGAQSDSSTVFPQASKQPGKPSKLADSERMQGLKKMKAELRAKGINPDHPTNEDFKKALTGGRE